MGTTRRRLVAIAVCNAITEDDDVVEHAVGSAMSSTLLAYATHMLTTDARTGATGCLWERKRNSPTWFFDYAITYDFMGSASWRNNFRIAYAIFQRIAGDLRSQIQLSNSKFRKPLPAEIKLAAFLLYAGGGTCERVAAQLGIGRSTVSAAVSTVSSAIAQKYQHVICFPTSEQDIATTMKGFQQISGVPYCVGAIDGTHIKWLACPQDQYYEYRCYKGYPSIVLFAVVTSDRRFIYVDIGKPGMLGDSTIYERSSLKQNMENGVWLEDDIPDLIIANVPVRPYLIGDCAFQLSQNMMKNCSEAEKNANPVLRTWDQIGGKTRTSVECAFGMLKHRFSVLKDGIKLHHENKIVLFILACVMLHNMCIYDRNVVEEYLLPDETDDLDAVVTAETGAGKKQRDALLYYITKDVNME